MATVKDRLFNWLYQNLAKPVLFAQDPETVHNRITRLGVALGRHNWSRALTKAAFSYHNPRLAQNIRGISFRNPVGLAAGFDKEGRLVDILDQIGFGFAEIGSVTGTPSKGNAKPRLWRLPRSRALIVNYGLNSSGAKQVAKRLGRRRFGLPLGLSIAKANSPRTVEDGAGLNDYLEAFRHLEPRASYITVNISCPNAYGAKAFSEPHRLERLLTAIDKIGSKKPVFIKMPPDLSEKEIDAITRVCEQHQVAGFICSNLTKDVNNPLIRGRLIEPELPGDGGISGKVVEKLAEEQLRYIYRKSGDRFVIIGCGGIFSAEDAYRKIRLGASLVQLITGMVFQGPQLIGQINRGIIERLDRDGLTHLGEAIGKDNPR